MHVFLLIYIISQGNLSTLKANRSQFRCLKLSNQKPSSRTSFTIFNQAPVLAATMTAGVRFRLNNLGPQPGSTKNRKRKGRGHSAGQGGSCGFGMRGQKSRSGPGVRKGFEGGQMPLYRRIPKLRGIAGGNFFTKTFSIVLHCTFVCTLLLLLFGLKH